VTSGRQPDRPASPPGVRALSADRYFAARAGR
jgi:hypothetical protein